MYSFYYLLINFAILNKIDFLVYTFTNSYDQSL